MRAPTFQEYMQIAELIKKYNPGARILPPFCYRIYEDRGRAVGFVGILKLTWHTAEIRHLYVLEPYRKRGYAREIVRKALREIETPAVVATTANEVSEGIFKRCGFVPVHRFTNPRTGNRICLLLLVKTAGREGESPLWLPGITN